MECPRLPRLVSCLLPRVFLPGILPIRSTATLQQFGQSLPSWLALVQRGETVAIMDGGHEVARLVPPEKPKAVPPAPAWSWKDHLAELEAIFPEPVAGVAEEWELSREDRF